MHPDKHLERAKNELKQAVNGYLDQGNTAIAYSLDDILIALTRLTEEDA